MNNTKNVEIAIERIETARRQRNYYLDLRDLRLTEIPLDISDMNYLMEVDLSHNFFSAIPEALYKMINLHSINVSYNYISKVEFIFGNYYLLSSLDISNNFLYDIPDSLDFLNSGIEIKFINNPFLKNLPDTFELYDIWTVRNYLKLIQEPNNLDKLYETKLIFVGRGEVGKTTLIKTLKDNKFKVTVGEEKATHGINIEQMNVEVFFPAEEPHYTHFTEIDNLHKHVYVSKEEILENWDEEELEDYEKNGFEYFVDISEYLNEFDEIERINFLSGKNLGDQFYISKDVTINLWDFGGQEIYYSTHQFFLTKRSIYIFVWEPRKDENESDFEYWLNTVKLLGQESPILVVMNKSDIRHISLNEKDYLSYFPNIIGFYQISCLTREGVYDLQNAIIEGIKTLPHLGSILPKSWQVLRRNLKNIGKDFINYTHFRDICIQNGVSEGKIEIQLLSDYLHDVGDIIHFSKDGNLKNLVIINPKWATKAVYSLIDSIPIQKQNGIFNYSDLESYLDLNNYPVETHHQLLQLMEKFNICFKVVGAQDLYIIPELLKDEIPNKEEFLEVKNGEGLKFKISFSFMPKGLINKLICKLYYLLTSNNYWKNGVVFNYDNSKALVLSNNLQKSLEIYIIGTPKRDLFTLIRNELLQIYLELKLKEDQDYFEQIPCNCDYCKESKPHYFKYSVLKRYVQNDRNTIICENSVLSISINELLDLYRNTNAETKVVYQILSAISQLQGLASSINSDENSRNKFVASFLSNKGVIAKDQSLWGKSATGLKQGELDMKIENEQGDIVTIFEGLNLTSVDTTIINAHIIKTIKKYDVNGLPEKYLGIYYTGKYFDDFGRRYFEYVESFNQEEIIFSAIFDESKQLTSHSEIRVFKVFYEKSGRKMSLIHILINMF